MQVLTPAYCRQLLDSRACSRSQNHRLIARRGSSESQGLAVAAPRGKTKAFLVPFPNNREREGLVLDLCHWPLHKKNANCLMTYD